MKIYIDTDEMYPCYYFGDEDGSQFGTEVEVTDEELHWLNEVNEDFHRMQDFLAKKEKETIKQNQMVEAYKLAKIEHKGVF